MYTFCMDSSLGYKPRNVISLEYGSYFNSTLAVEKLSDCFPKWLHHFTWPQAVYEGSNFSTSLLTLVIVCLSFDISYLSMYRVVSHCGSHLHFPANDVEHLFMCLFPVSISLLEKCLFKSFAHF